MSKPRWHVFTSLICRGNKKRKEKQDPHIPNLCITEDPAQGRRSSTFATLQAVGKSTERLPTCEHTCAGIQGRGLLCAAGCCVARGSHAATSYKDTGEHTQVPFFFFAASLFVQQENSWKTSYSQCK